MIKKQLILYIAISAIVSFTVGILFDASRPLVEVLLRAGFMGTLMGTFFYFLDNKKSLKH